MDNINQWLETKQDGSRLSILLENILFFFKTVQVESEQNFNQGYLKCSPNSHLAKSSSNKQTGMLSNVVLENKGMRRSYLT